jgi:hypothetical protein
MGDDEYDKLAFALVSAEDAAREPYPYVKVTDDGKVHELDQEDRAYLQERFHPCDGARPFVKSSYEDKNGWGNLGGFCARKHIPTGIRIDAAPIDRAGQLPLIDELREMSEKAGLEFVDNEDGSYTTRKKYNNATKVPWWAFWRRR